jgi:hypothetical protein
VENLGDLDAGGPSSLTYIKINIQLQIIKMTVKPSKEGNVMSYRKVISLAAVAALGIACVATEAFAARAARGGAVAVRGGAVGARGGVAYRGGAVAARGGVAYRGGAVAARGGYYRPGVGAAAVVGGAAIGAAAAYPYYNQQCGYYPYPRCY